MCFALHSGSRLGQKSMKAEQLTEGGVIFIVLVAKGAAATAAPRACAGSRTAPTKAVSDKARSVTAPAHNNDASCTTCEKGKTNRRNLVILQQ
jgi:hypothetical protein